MAVVIRLQGLPITAGSEDIRNFFSGLKIPDGGVHIIGGVREEAFIIFASDEDARRAMVRSGGCIKGSPANLLLSSKSEMQSILEESTRKAELELKSSHREGSRRHEVDVSGRSRRADHMQAGNRGHSQSDHSYDEARRNLSDEVCLLLTGMPFSVTENDVRSFFHGLSVEGVILGKNARGQNNGEGLVKFATSQDARDGLMRDREYIGPRFVRIRPVREKIWLEADRSMAMGENGNGKFRRGRSPTSSQRYPRARTRSISPLPPPTHSPRYSQTRTRSRSPLPPLTHSPRYSQTRTRSRSPLALPTQRTRYPPVRSRSRSPLGPPTHSARQPQACTRSRSPSPPRRSSPPNEEFCVMLENLSHAVEKRDIKEFFRYRLEDDQILFLLDDKGRRTSSLFVLFNSLRDYCSALTRHNEKLNHKNVHISPISREKMMSILESHTGRPGQRGNVNDSEKSCLYVRNMPFDVRKVEIMDFFEMGSVGFSITEDKVFLLRDHKGAGLGEALVVFGSEEEAMSALHLNGRRFLGTVVMLKCISLSQMREFGVEPPAAQESMLREERYSSSNSEVPHYPGDVEVGNLRMHTDGNRANSNLPHRGSDLYPGGSYASLDGGNGLAYGDFGPPSPQFEGPTCLKLVNLPFQIKMDEIYDFCYGFRVIPGSVTVLHDKNGLPSGSATVVFESRQEALTAVKELSGRPIGARKIQLIFV